jgi:hypothetical protein
MRLRHTRHAARACCLKISTNSKQWLCRATSACFRDGMSAVLPATKLFNFPNLRFDVEYGIALGIEPDQDFAKHRMELFYVLRRIPAVLKIKFVSTALFRTTCRHMAVRGGIAENRGPKLLVYQNASFFCRLAHFVSCLERIVDNLLRCSNSDAFASSS